MAELNLQNLVQDLSYRYPDKGASDFSQASFDLIAIVGHRCGYDTLSEYKVRWKPSRMEKVHLLTGLIDGRPLKHDIEKALQEPDNEDRVRVFWRDTWVPSDNVVSCGEFVHEFWTRMFLEGCSSGTKYVI